jgi:hypothetical protein
MTTIGRDTNKVTKGFRRLTREGGIIHSVEYWLKPMEPKERAHIHSSTKKDSQRDLPIQGLTGSTVEHNTDVL